MTSMNSAMEQTRYWMWNRRKLINTITRPPPPPPFFNSPMSVMATTSSYHESWEEQAFAEDSAGLLGGCIWPPRSYTCSFCRREFRSAQALGGHMNVHRRDRARLKQSSSRVDESPEQYPDQGGPIEYHGPNPNPNPNSGVMGSSVPLPGAHNLISASHSLPNIIREQRGETRFIAPRSFTNPIPVRLPSGLELKLELGNWKVREVGSKGKRDWEEEDDAIIMLNNKRRRVDAVFSPIVKPSSGNLQLIGRPEVLKLSPSPVEELDLELRLGDPPKIK